MATCLIERFGAGNHKVGDIVELTESQAAFYAAKVRKIADTPTLEVATPSKAADVVKAISEVETLEELEAFSDDDRKSVAEAYNKKLDELTA